MGCKVLLCVFLLTLVNIVSPTEVQAGLDALASLPCNVTLPHEAVLSLVEAGWTSNGSDVASFGNTATQIKDGFSWDNGEFVRGDFSLTVLKAALDLQGVYNCTVSYNSTLLHSSDVALTILASPSISVPHRRVVLETESWLDCHADGFYPPPVAFSWTRDGRVIRPPQQVEGQQTADGLYRAEGNLTSFHPSAEDQNLTFGCRVTHAGSDKTLEFHLNITYVPTVSVAVVPSASRDAPLTLYCDVERFYPEDVSVSWFRNGSVLPEPPAVEENPDGTYRTRRYFTLSPEQREEGGEVECAVDQPGVTHPARGSAYLEQLDPPVEAPVLTKSAKASVALMCISLVLVFLLCFGFSWRRRDEKQKSLSVSGIILPPRVIVGHKGRVTVSIAGRRVDRVQTSWFLNDNPITDTSFTVSEKGPLLPSRGEMGYYKLHTQGPLHSSGSGTQQLISALTFIPQISVHKGAVFKCQVSYVGKDKIVEERVSEKFTILCKKRHLNSFFILLLSRSDIISLTVQASHFHPDVITFRWFCQGGELSPVASQAQSSPRPDAEGFFSASSQCKLPRTELEKGGTKVWVSVHHIALKQPVTRETRGFIRRPNVSDIVSSSSSSDQSVTLGCEITDFYPPNISVTWLKLRDRERDDREEEVIEGGEVWGPIQTHPTLYRATATLKRKGTGEERKERRGGIVCRVEHSSLLEPIEKHWNNADVETRAAVSDPDTEGIEYIDEHADGENNDERDKDRKTDEDAEASGERREESDALHINRVNLARGPGDIQRSRLRVCLEVTHPALKLPVYRTWTGPSGESLKMEPEGPVSRAERTWWTVWVRRSKHLRRVKS
ncbi:uncharacterized protein LOC143001896 [Genypterus blacodes]|uniref:uncharacterized protein LOC143001896 n=1 Tax=Genypterus blacodes TaxID=154954 RepID=UPI003F75C32E